MKSVVGFVPSKLNSKRLPRKNILPLGGRPLINWVLETLSTSKVDESIVYAADREVQTYIEPDLPYRFVSRPHWLDSDEATVQDFVGSFLDQVDAEVVVLLHATSPFIKTSTVNACVDAVLSGSHASAFTALELQRFAWFRGRPLNYSPELPTPRTQDLESVLIEQSGLYVFTRELFEATGQRIAGDPYIHPIDTFEGHDIDTPDELELAELILSARQAGHRG